MKYLIDTEKGTCVPYENTETSITTLADLFEAYEGTVEYNGIVAEIQKWYYGFVSKTAWCATAVSYFAAQLHLPFARAENVRVLLDNVDKTCTRIYNREYGDSKDYKIKRGDILFFLWDNEERMSNVSSKHVGIAFNDSYSPYRVECIGGNQNNCICVKSYNRSNLYAVYRPPYKEV